MNQQYNVKMKLIIYMQILQLVITKVIIVNSKLQNGRDKYENLSFTSSFNFTDIQHGSHRLYNLLLKNQQYNDNMDIDYNNMITNVMEDIFLKSDNQMMVLIVSAEHLSTVNTLSNILAAIISEKTIFAVDTSANETFLREEIGSIFSQSHKNCQRINNTDLVFISIGSIKLYEVVLQQARLQDQALNVQGYFTFFYKYILFFEHMKDLQKMESRIENINHVTAFVKENIDNEYGGSFMAKDKYLQRIGTRNLTIVPEALIYSAMWKKFTCRKFELIEFL